MSELESAVAAAHAAGTVLLERWPAEREVRVKGFRDIVTEADVAAQATIIERLKGDFPDHAILAEEGGAPYSGAGDLCPTWVVDPLDGTTNYAHRLPNWSVAIGLVYGSEARVGVVHDPLRSLVFWAERGRGAYLSRAGGPAERLEVSRTERFASAVVAVDWARDDDVRRETVRTFDKVALACTSVRSLGSACLAAAYLAAGWLDAYFHFALQPWDMAGPGLIVAEAGGRLTTPEGEPWQVGQPRLACSN